MQARLALALVAAGVCSLGVGEARADLFELKWATEGYFLTRTVYLTNMAATPRSPGGVDPGTGEALILPEVRRTSYIYSGGRIMPTLSYEKLAAFKMQIDVIDDVLWGDNNGLASAPLFATDVSNQGIFGGEPVESIEVPRAWLEFQVPVGLMRVGRMPSDWGMGLLANGGGTGTWDPAAPEYENRRPLDYFHENDFGEKHFGSTADRILFATKPITIAKTIAGHKDTESKLIIGYAYDKLAEAPFLPAEGADRTVRPFGQQGFISRGKDDDVNEHVLLALWNDPELDLVRYTDELRLGTYHVFRVAKQGSTFPSDPKLDDPDANCSAADTGFEPCEDDGSFVWIGDIWWKLRYGPWYTEGEGYVIAGESFGGIPFPAKNQKKDAFITGGVARFGYLTEMYDGILEVGHASGDERLADEEFKQRGLHPDYNVGLILFEEILREASARAFGPPFFSSENPEGAKGFFSQGGVINANYGLLKGRYRPGIAGLEVIGQTLFAWADELAEQGPAFYPFDDQVDSSYLGTEIDLAIKTSWAGDHMLFSLETGYLLFGPVLEQMFPNADSSFTLQSRVSFVW